MTEQSAHDPACAIVHGETARDDPGRERVTVFASSVAEYLLRDTADTGFRGPLRQPDATPATRLRADGMSALSTAVGWTSGADDVVTDHHGPEHGPLLRDVLGDVLAEPVRWVGVLGNPQRDGAQVRALRARDVAANDIAAEDIARRYRPIGFDIGSRAPAEIALATATGLVADRHARAGNVYR